MENLYKTTDFDFASLLYCEGKKILNLDEKLKAQRGIKDMEKKRNEMRKKLYEAQDTVEGRKEKLIEQVESQLKQKSKLESLFTIRWRVV